MFGKNQTAQHSKYITWATMFLFNRDLEGGQEWLKKGNQIL